MTPKISIGVVVYNGADQIKTLLDSIVSQQYKNFELIIVDGHSSDGTQDIVKAYLQHVVSVFVSEKDSGIYDAMNKVCSLAVGDWLIFLGCDDVLRGDLGVIAETLVQADAVYYGNMILKSRGEIYGGRYSKIRLMQNNICHQAIFYPRCIYKKYSYDLNYPWLADYELNLKLARDGIPMIHFGITVSIFNDLGRSSSGDELFSRKKLGIIYSYFGLGYSIIYLILKFSRTSIPVSMKNRVRRYFSGT